MNVNTTTHEPVALRAANGLIQIPQGPKLWALGYLPEKKTFCLGSLTEGLADIFNEGDEVIIRFNEPGRPVMLFKQPKEKPIEPNECRVVFGSFFVFHVEEFKKRATA